MQPTVAEENYLKAILKHSVAGPVSTNALARELNTTPASVTDMIKRLSEKEWVDHTPYRGVALTAAGQRLALRTLRKHRLWEVFLVEKLSFSWDNVHATAEQLEHIASDELIERLDAFLGYPRFDPHGDPIPDAQGVMQQRPAVPLLDLTPGTAATVCGMQDEAPEFLRHLDRLGIQLGNHLRVLEILSYDQSVVVAHAGQELVLSRAVAQNLLVVAG